MSPSLWRHADFMKLWAGQTVSELGSVVTRTAVPLVALLVLGAGPLQMALLVVSGSLAVLLVGLRRRAPGSTGCCAGRCSSGPTRSGRCVLLSIPAAYVAGVLRMEQLYLVVFLEGCLGALFDAAYPAYVPSLIGVDRVVEGNSKLATSASLAEIGGPGFAGALVQVIGAPLRDPGRCRLVRRVGDLAAPDPERRSRPARRGPRRRRCATRSSRACGLVRHHPLLVPLALRSVFAHVAGAFYWRPVHDLPDPGPAAQPVPAGHRHLGGRRRLARRLAVRVAGHRPLRLRPDDHLDGDRRVDRRRAGAPGRRPDRARDADGAASRSWSVTAWRRSRTWPSCR